MKTRNHKGRKDLIGEHKSGDAGQAFFALLFLIVWIADSFILKYSISLNEIIPGIIRVPAGILVLMASGYLSMTGLNIVFGEVREKPEVIRKSVFGIVRHPIYLGEILLYLGLLFFSMSIASAVIWLLAVIFLYYISRYEEKILLNYFGEEYRTYMQEVPMWLPKISSLFGKKQF